MKYTFILYLLFSSLLTLGQSFEGTLTYSVSLEVDEKMLKHGLTRESLIKNMKVEGTWSDTIWISYKQGNYYKTSNSVPKSWSIYVAEKNNIYTLHEEEESVFCEVMDASIDTEFAATGKMPLVMKLDTTAIVGVDTCSIVRVKWSTGTFDYYYNQNKFEVDATLFSNHIYDGWAEYLKISQALPVKIVGGAKGLMTVSLTLVDSNSGQLDDELFKTPDLTRAQIKDRLKFNNKELLQIKKRGTMSDKAEKEEVIIVDPECPPTFKDGGEAGMQKFIQDNLNYPQGECTKGIVYVDVTVDATGQGRNFTIAKGLSPNTDAEALRVVKLMKFNPGTFNGIPKEMKVRIPIKFEML
jgi:TonB family protein